MTFRARASIPPKDQESSFPTLPSPTPPSPSPFLSPLFSFPPPFSLPLPSWQINSLPNPASRWVWVSAVSSPAGSGAEPQPKLNLVHFKWKIWHLVNYMFIKFGTNAEIDRVLHMLIHRICQRRENSFPIYVVKLDAVSTSPVKTLLLQRSLWRPTNSIWLLNDVEIFKSKTKATDILKCKTVSRYDAVLTRYNGQIQADRRTYGQTDRLPPYFVILASFYRRPRKLYSHGIINS